MRRNTIYLILISKPMNLYIPQPELLGPLGLPRATRLLGVHAVLEEHLDDLRMAVVGSTAQCRGPLAVGLALGAGPTAQRCPTTQGEGSGGLRAEGLALPRGDKGLSTGPRRGFGGILGYLGFCWGIFYILIN